MEFEQRKAAALSAISSPNPDKSPKGTIDTPIISLLNTINSHPSFFTTSSCSGRISLFSSAATSSSPSSKGSGKWVFITHQKTDPEIIVPVVFQNPSSERPNLVFRFEPLILAVDCADVAAAQRLVSIAVGSGFRESGITSVSKRVIVGIRCSIRLEVPLGDRERVFVSPEYVSWLVEVANDKMEANRRRADGFLAALLSSGFGGEAATESRVSSRRMGNRLCK